MRSTTYLNPIPSPLSSFLLTLSYLSMFLCIRVTCIYIHVYICVYVYVWSVSTYYVCPSVKTVYTCQKLAWYSSQREIAPPPRRSMHCRRIVIYEASTPEYFSHCPRSNDKSSCAAMVLDGAGWREGGRMPRFCNKVRVVNDLCAISSSTAAKCNARRNCRFFRDDSSRITGLVPYWDWSTWTHPLTYSFLRSTRS